MTRTSRRQFLAGVSALAGMGMMPASLRAFSLQDDPELPFRISLAQWSLHKTLFSGQLSNLEFPAEARRLGFDGIEYVNAFFPKSAKDLGYLGELKRRCDLAGVESVLIMVDGEGFLGDSDAAARSQAIENHRKWIGAAAFLGCHAIRVNARSMGSREEQQHLAADGLRRLTELGKAEGIKVIVENHGGLSSDGSWLAAVMREVDDPWCGTLPDFGNFHLGDDEWYDRYKGVEEMMPFAHAVSAKSHDFDIDGNEQHTDYRRMLDIVMKAGYRGWIGVEYEGGQLSEEEGILATKKLLERVRRSWMGRHLSQ